MGGSSSSGNSSKERRYAPYIEMRHISFLSLTATHRDIMIDDSPYAGHSDIEIDDAFFGTGYLISNFSSLYDMFGKHMAGLDIEEPWDTSLDRIVSAEEVEEGIAEKIKLVDDEIDKVELPSFQVGMRNINAVGSSSFVVGRAMVEDKRVKLHASVSLEMRAELLSNVGDELLTTLNWEKKIVTTYAEVMKVYYMYKPVVGDSNASYNTRNLLWPFVVLSFEGAALSTMQSVMSWNRKAEPRKRSAISTGLSVASYTATGAYIGSSFPPYGTVIGAVVGFVIGVGMMLLERS